MKKRQKNKSTSIKIFAKAKKILLSKIVIPIIVSIIFLLVAFFTMSDYGINYDSPVHFARGQAFLRFFVSGKTDYKGLTPYCMDKDWKFPASVDFHTGEVCDRHRKTRVSQYESYLLDFNFFKGDIYGHPPLSDIFTAVTNQIFFVKLGWVEDIEAYHLYNVLTVFILAVTIGVWTYQTFGIFPSVVAVLTFYLFPLLLGEQHFNVKDPPMAAFFTLSLYFFWRSLTEKKAKYMLFSAIAGGISFATKFNFVFAPFILLPWVAFFIGKQIYDLYKKHDLKKIFKIIPKRIILALILYPIIVFFIFYFSWPVLWDNPVHNIGLVIKFYKDIGTSTTCPYNIFASQWFSTCPNYIPLQYILYTIPLISLILFAWGFIGGIFNFKKHYFVTVLWVWFLCFTILRVTVPGSSIYGGLRQVIEFIAPFSMLAGLGALIVRDILIRLTGRAVSTDNGKKLLKIFFSLAIIFSYIPIALKMIAIHPNENVYFNPLIGGLKGAAEKNFYAHSVTYGNAYYQAVRWLNVHGEKNAKISLIWGLNQNISISSLRGDITHLSIPRSGYNQKGEYLLTTMEQGNPVFPTFRYRYANSFLDPVFMQSVEGVPLVKLWKNDAAHVKQGLNLRDEQKEKVTLQFKGGQPSREMHILLDSKKYIKRIEFRFAKSECKLPFVDARISLSSDGKYFYPQADAVNDFTEAEVEGYNADFVYLFTADEASEISIEVSSKYPCDIKTIDTQVYTFSDLHNQRNNIKQ